MDIESLREYCLSFKGVTEAIKWESHLTFLVGDKLFLLIPTESHPPKCSLKVPEEHFDEIIENDNYHQAPYFARRKWIQVLNIENCEEADLKNMIATSYDLVKSNLTKKLQKAIDEL